MLRGIELTDAQKAQVKTIFETNKPDEATMQQMRSFRDARKNGGTLTDDQKAQMKAFRQQFRQKQEGVRQQILAILTPEQQQQLEARKAEMQKRRDVFGRYQVIAKNASSGNSKNSSRTNRPITNSPLNSLDKKAGREARLFNVGNPPYRVTPASSRRS